MSDIKVKQRGTIKSIDKKITQAERIKDNILSTKQKINDLSSDNSQNAGDYANTKIQSGINIIKHKSINEFNNCGNKSVKQTYSNVKKTKEKIKNIKGIYKQGIKTSRKTGKLAKKSIKTADKTIKGTKETAKTTVKASQKAIQMSKAGIRASVKATKIATKSTISAIKAIIATAKTLITAIIAGGWVAVVVILVIVLIAGFVAAIFNSTDDDNFDLSQIPNSEIILVAKSQLGNEGGEPYWSWYGFNERVAWCACYVSWCANECGYIDKGIIPKFSACVNGIEWFKNNNQWQDRGESYYPIIGDIIFFDWYDENGNQDGISDHVGIVTKTDIDNKTIYTIEGNSDDKCREKMYSFDDVQVMGYGTPKY